MKYCINAMLIHNGLPTQIGFYRSNDQTFFFVRSIILSMNRARLRDASALLSGRIASRYIFLSSSGSWSYSDDDISSMSWIFWLGSVAFIAAKMKSSVFCAVGNSISRAISHSEGSNNFLFRTYLTFSFIFYLLINCLLCLLILPISFWSCSTLVS